MPLISRLRIVQIKQVRFCVNVLAKEKILSAKIEMSVKAAG